MYCIIGPKMSECLEGFVSAVKALFPISAQTYHQEGKKPFAKSK